MVFAAALSSVAAFAGSATCEKTDRGVRCVRDGKVVWNLDVDTPEGKPALHPLTLPSGRVLTDFHPADHFWHLGFWFSFKYLNGVNYWEPVDIKGRGAKAAGETRVVKRSIVCRGGGADVALDIEYGPAGKDETVLAERRTMTFSEPDAHGGYTIGIAHEFTARRDVTIERTPPFRDKKGNWQRGYTGWTLRIPKELADEFDVSGTDGRETPRGICGEERREVHFVSRANGEGVRFTVLESPADSTRFYIWADKRSVNPSPVFASPVTVKAGETLRLKYELAVEGCGPRVEGSAANRQLPTEMDLEWNERYDISVPYEVEINPAKLARLAGIAKGSGFTVKADGRELDVVAFAGKEPETIDLRFKVPAGTKRLTCEAGGGTLALSDSSQIDNLFAGALEAVNAGKWSVPGDVKAMPQRGGMLFSGTAFAPRTVSYEVDVPARFAGKPVKVEFDVTSRSKMVWAGTLKVRQLDAAGKELPESVSDPRWTSQMRPPQKFTAYREDGVIHPRARKLRVEIGLRSTDRDIDEYGMPLKDKSGLFAQLFVSRIAVRPAAQLPFPKYDDTFFAEGVSGEAGDKALALGGKYGGGFWFQTHSQACWAEAYEFRDENDCFFPTKAGTVEAWFKADWPKMAGDTATLFDYYQGYVASGRQQAKGSFMALRWNRSNGKMDLTLRDAADRKFHQSAKVKLPAGQWFHVAAQWKPGTEAQVFVDGKVAMTMPLDGFKEFDITDRKIKHPNDIAGMEFFLGANAHGTRLMTTAGSRNSDPLFEGAVDACRVSSGCRYAGEFTPAKRFVCDGDTRALFDFDRSFDGVSGGGVGFILGCFRASSDRVDHKLRIGGRDVQYYPAENLPENDPAVVLDIHNYPIMPKAAEYTAARREVRRSFEMKAGDRAEYECPANGVYPDYVEIANVGDTTLVYPLVLGTGELDVRSFGDLAEGLDLGGATDREKANRLFQMVISASDYFMNHNAIFPYGSDMPKQVCYDAMVVLNGYCGFECGPLNNLAANMFATVAMCPAVQTGGFGHSFEEVFYDGKNHIYDLSAQKFFPAMDNETASYLREVGDQPGIHNRVRYSADHFMRKGTRGHHVQNPDYRPKVGVCLCPGETFRVWRGNNGECNNLQCKTSYGKGKFKWSTPESKVIAPIYEKETGSLHKEEPIRRIDRFFPDLSSGFITFSGKPDRGNPAFTNVTASTFCYNVRSGYPITWAKYAARKADGSVAPLEISTNFKDYRPLSAPGEDGAVTLDYLVRARHGYWIRVKAPISTIARFDAATEVQVNRRTFPGHAKPGRNEFTFKCASSGKARVTVQWRENVKDVKIAGGAFSGTIPGFERQTVLIDPAKPLSLAVEGVSQGANVTVTKGLRATLAGGTLMVAAADANAEPFTGAVTIDDGGAKRELTVVACAGARFALAKDGRLTGGAEKVEPNADRVQACAMLRKAGDGVKLSFDPIPAGEYIVFSCQRFEGGLVKGENGARVIVFKIPGAKNGKEWWPIAAAANGNFDFLKAPYARKGQRGNWKWDYPFVEEGKGASYNGWEIMNMPFAATGELEFKLKDNRPNGVEFAGAMVLPASVSQDFRAELKKLMCGLDCQPARVTP